MFTDWLLAFIPIIALIVNVLGQISMVHIVKNIGLAILSGLLLGILINVFLLSWYFSRQEMIPFYQLFADSFISLFTYCTLSFCYFAFLNLNITSLRIRVLRELLNNPQIQIDQLMQRYSPQELIKKRINRLESTGQICKQNQHWILESKKLMLFVWVTLFLRKLIIPGKNTGC